MTSGSIILSHSGDSCFACCVARVFWVVSVIVLSSFIMCGPPYSGTHTKSLMCINAEEGVKAKDQNPLLPGFSGRPTIVCVQYLLSGIVANMASSGAKRNQSIGVFETSGSDIHTHMIHVWYVYVYLPRFTIKNQPNVGKYTSPMNPMGYSPP